MNDSGNALQLAEQVMKSPETYPAQLVLLAMMLLLEPGSQALCEQFLDAYHGASLIKGAMVGAGLPYPPAEADYYDKCELHSPGIQIGIEPLNGWPLKVFLEQLRRHAIVTGTTGTGKTNLLQRLAMGIAELDRGSPEPSSVIVFDRHDNFVGLQELPGQDWLVLKARECRFALLEKVTEGFPRKVLNLVAENRGLIKSLNVLEDAQERIERALQRMDANPPVATLSHLINAAKSLDFRHTKRDYLLSLLTEIEDMHRSVGCIWNWACSDMMEKLLAPGMRTVIRTGGLELREELFQLTWMLLYAIESGNARPRSHQVFFIIDELQPLFRKRWHDQRAVETLKTAVLTARQPSVGIIGGAQIPSELEAEILASAAVIICTGLQDLDNVGVTASAMGIPFQAANKLFQSLAINEAVFRSAGRPGPLKIEVPLAQIPRGWDEAKQRQRAKRFQESCNIQPPVTWQELFKALSQQRRRQKKTPSQRAIRLLQIAAQHHKSPKCLKELAGICGLGLPEASHSSRELEACGLARRCSVAIGRSRMVFVEPTSEGFRFLGISPPAGTGRGGPGHRYCLGLVEARLQRKGYSTTREAEVMGKRIDLLAVKSGSKVFVEVETSNENAARNASEDLAVADTSVRQIAIICPTRKVLRKVEKTVRAAISPGELARFAFRIVTDL